MDKTTKCQHCTKEVALPFKCPYCGGYFCTEHRLPENHACPEYWRARAPREEVPPTIVEEPTRPPYKYTITYAPKPATFFWFSTTEIKHLTLGALLVMGVGLSFTPNLGLATSMWPSVLISLASLAIVLTLSFLLHELAHKFSAQRLGLWAEFRLTTMGALVTLVSILLPFFKIISPGAVMIAGPVTRETAGKTAFTGPFVNILLSSICIAISKLFPNTATVVFGAWINALIAFFNLIPFGAMDGLKVFWWNKVVWILAFVTAFALMIYTYTTIL